MGKIDLHLLLVKMLTRSATKSELDAVDAALQDGQQKEIFKEYLQLDFIVRIALKQTNIEQTKRVLLKRIRADKKEHKQKKIRRGLQIAASFLVLFTSVYWITLVYQQEEHSSVVGMDSSSITLFTAGNTQIVQSDRPLSILDEDGNVVAEKKENTIVFQTAERADQTENILKVPYGKSVNVILADGSKVFLNAGSTLRFPTNFVGVSQREISLTGEAYFDIVQDKSKPFFVHTEQVQVKVVGTVFNVSNYPEDVETKVVLVEGTVDLSIQDAQQIERKKRLRPGEQGVFNKMDYSLTTEIVNPSRSTSWLLGREIFVNETFEHILIKLERKYNVIIINNNKGLAKERFNATIDTNEESIEQVMEFFNKIYNIEYQIMNNKIIIK